MTTSPSGVRKRKPRKPETILRDLNGSLWAIERLSENGTPPVSTAAHARELHARELLAELRAALKDRP